MKFFSLVFTCALMISTEFTIASGIRYSKTGAKFIPVTVEELVKKYKMTEQTAKKFVGSGAYEDESGMIWGDKGPGLMDHKDAQKYCNDMGAKLPSGYPEDKNGEDGFPNQNSDFVRLCKYLGETLPSKRDYSPYLKNSKTEPVLPNLIYINSKDKKPYNYVFWTSSFRSSFKITPYVFFGRDGDIFYFSHDEPNFSVRCVLN